MLNPEQIEEKNRIINEAIYVSQMMDHPGFIIVNKYLETKRNEIRFQDIFGLNDSNLHDQKGMALMIEDLDQYFQSQKTIAMNKKINPETGEAEILNSKK